MRIGFHGNPIDEPEIRAGFIGCGSHAFRNIYPTFQFAPVRLVATCDLALDKAQAFARQFGAERAYSDYQHMLAQEELDAVFVVTSYDERGRPRYPAIALDCLDAGCHVWIEKPPAASCAEIEALQAVAQRNGRRVMVGMKKMFYPANEKARELMDGEDFGPVALATLQYPQFIPSVGDLRRYADGEACEAATGFLDHLVHPAALMVFLLGMPRSLYYERSPSGAGLATFTFPGGAIAMLAMTHGAANNGGLERTVIVSERGRHIIVENNLRVSYVRSAPVGYGDTPSFYAGTPQEATAATWEPEFSLGQLYNKGLFLLGYYGEVNEFARAVLEGRAPRKGTLGQAWQVTRIFEAFGEGPRKVIEF